MAFKPIAGLISAAAISVALAGTASAQDDGQDRDGLAVERQRRECGQLCQDGDRNRRRDDQQRQCRSRQSPADQGCWPHGLEGAKIELIFADNQGTPAVGQNQALRLITEEKVAALIGAYQSGITLTASAIAEKYGIPFVNGELVAANLTERGFKWFFRTTPIASDFAKTIRLPQGHEGRRRKTDNIAMVHENTEYGTSVASVISSVFKETASRSRRTFPTPPTRPTCRARCCSSRRRSPTS